MQNEDKKQFVVILARMFALYPNASMSEATAPAWFTYLADFDLALVAAAMKRAVDSSPSFVPTAPTILEHCKALAKTSLGKPAPDLTLKALPEPEPELDASHPRHAEFEAIKAKARSGELTGDALMKAFVGFVAGGQQ